jgi:phosphatidate cytidylyltransferase
MGTLTKRILVALAGIPLLLFLTFWNVTLPFKIVVVLALGIALLEYLRMADDHQLKTLRTEGMVALGFMLLPWMVRPLRDWGGRDAFLLGLFILTLCFLWSSRPLKEMVVSVSVTFFGAAYFGVLGHYFFRLRDLPQGAWHLVWLYVATWAYDTGGYFGGRWFGKHHFAPLASPKKSVEGCIGGFLLVLAGLLFLWKAMAALNVPSDYNLADVAALSVLLSLFGQLGDLVESVIKRSLSAKDSGSLLPGHGGMFDRIDSLLFNAPILFYYLVLLKKL